MRGRNERSRKGPAAWSENPVFPHHLPPQRRLPSHMRSIPQDVPPANQW
jgi:hypothetical protein